MGWVIEVWSLWTLGTKLQSFSGLPAFQFLSPIVVMGKAASGEVGGSPRTLADCGGLNVLKRDANLKWSQAQPG